MTRISKTLRYAAFTIMAIFGLFGGLFVAGEAVDDPGGWAAVWISALWFVPLVALSFFAFIRPASADALFVVITAAVVLFTVADATVHIVPRDNWGPVAAIAVFALGVALAFLGLHRPTLAGLLMVVAGLGQLMATVIDRGTGVGAGLSGMLGGSSGVFVIPIVLVGMLFLASGTRTRELSPPNKPRRARPAH